MPGKREGADVLGREMEMEKKNKNKSVLAKTPHALFLYLGGSHVFVRDCVGCIVGDADGTGCHHDDNAPMPFYSSSFTIPPTS